MNIETFNPSASHVTKSDLTDFLYRDDTRIYLPSSITKKELVKLVQERLEAGLLKIMRALASPGHVFN